jgi:hypothetical protein
VAAQLAHAAKYRTKRTQARLADRPLLPIVGIFAILTLVLIPTAIFPLTKLPRNGEAD